MTAARAVGAATPRSSDTRRLASGTLWGFAAELLLLPTGLVTSAVLARVLGPADYGLFTLVASLIVWVSWTTTAMLARATVKLVSEARDDAGVAASVLRWRAALGATSFLLVFLLAGPLAGLLGAPGATPFIRAMSVDLLLFNLARAYRETLTGRGRFREVAIVGAVRWIARMLFIVALVLWTESLMAAVVGSVLATATELLCAHRYQRFDLAARGSLSRAELWTVAGPLLVYGATTQLHLRVDLFALSALGSSVSEVGAYGAAQNLAVTPGLFAMAFSPLVLASVSTLRGQGRTEEARRLAHGALRLTFCLLAFAGLVAATAGPIVRAIFGAPFEAAGPLLALLFPASLFLVVATVSISVVTAGETGAPLGSIGIALVLSTIAAHLYAVPRHGAVGAALVTLASSFALAVAGVALVRVRWHVSALPSLARGIVVALLAYAIASGITLASPWMLMLTLVGGSFLIAVAMLLLGELSLAERAAMRVAMRGAMGAWMGPVSVTRSVLPDAPESAK